MVIIDVSIEVGGIVTGVVVVLGVVVVAGLIVVWDVDVAKTNRVLLSNG